MVGKTEKDPLIIYYGFSTYNRPEHEQVLLGLQPRPLLSKIIKERKREDNNYKIDYSRLNMYSSGYHACTALHEIIKSTYVIDAPIDAEVFFDDTGKIIDQKGYNFGAFISRVGSFENCFSADLFYDILLFSEESVEVKTTPPYMDKPMIADYGYASASQINIGKWFRPLPIVFQLWPHVKEFKMKSGEPMLYLHFENPLKRPIILKEFKITEEIVKISAACMNNKDIFPFESMQKMYNRFTSTSMRARTLAEIKKNIIE